MFTIKGYCVQLQEFVGVVTYFSATVCLTLTPAPSSGLHADRGDRLDSMSLPVKSSSDSSKDEADDRPIEEELDSFLGDRIRAGEPPQPLSEQGDSSSGRETR